MSKFIEEPGTVPQLSVRGETFFDCGGGFATT